MSRGILVLAALVGALAARGAAAGWICDGIPVSESDRVVWFGAGREAYIEYDGADLVIEPDAQGSGTVKLTGTLDIGGTGNLLYDGVSGLHVQSRDSFVRLGSGEFFLCQDTGGSELYMLTLMRPGMYGASLLTEGGIQLDTDEDWLWFGEDQDAYVGYDGADLVIKPDEVGSGCILLGNHAKLRGSGRRLYFGAADEAYLECDGQGLNIVPEGAADGVRVRDGTAANVRLDVEAGGENDTTFGLWEGLGTRNSGFSVTYDGGANVLSVRAHNGAGAGTEFLRMYKARDDLYIIRDTGKVVFGAGEDASIQYDGTDMVLTPDEAGTGIVQVDGALAFESKVTKDTAAAVVLTAKDCRNTIRINGDNDAIDYTLPAAAPGLTVTFANCLYDQVITVDAGAGDVIVLNDGTALAAGYAVDSSGAKDDKATFVAIDDICWMIFREQNAWVDGGAD